MKNKKILKYNRIGLMIISLFFFFGIKSNVQAETLSMVNDISPGTGSGYPEHIVSTDGLVFFAADDGINGTELWKSDGTETGTVMVKDIYAGALDSNPSELIAINNVVYFSARDGVNGYELWKSDGTEAGTVMVKDIYTGSSSSNVTEMFNFNGVLYFSAEDASYGAELWRSDGTEAGTYLVRDISSSGYSWPNGMVEMDGFFYFGAHDGSDEGLWRSDGTEVGTTKVKDFVFYPSDLVNVNGTLFFGANDGLYGLEPWKSDGTEAGTVMLKDTWTGGSSYCDNFVNNDGVLYFRSYSNLWKSDGTEAGTVAVTTSTSYFVEDDPGLFVYNGEVYFSTDTTDGQELWKSDGTEVGTVMVKDINPGTGHSLPDDLFVFNEDLYFSARYSDNNRWLFRTDGTEEGTEMLLDDTLSAPQDPSEFTDLNGSLYFNATTDDGSSGYELWIYEMTNYTLSYSADSNGIILGDSSQTVNEGESGTAVTAVPSSGYHFVDWSDGLTDNPRTDTNVTTDITVTANFAIDAANSHTLTYTAGENGSVTGNLSQTIEEGEDGTAVTAVPNSSYEFTNWSDGSTDNPRTDTNVIEDISVVANFGSVGTEEEEDEEEEEEDPTIKIKSIKEDCESLEIEISTGGEQEKEKLDFKVEYKNQVTGEKQEQKIKDIKTNSDGRTVLTLTNLNQDTEYKIKVKYKESDDYIDWSESKEAKTKLCTIETPTTTTEEIPLTPIPEDYPEPVKEEEQEKEQEEKKDNKKELTSIPQEPEPTIEEKEFPMKAATTAAAVVGGGGVASLAWFNRRRLLTLIGFTWMKKRNWRVFDVETGDAIEGALVSLESPEGEIIEEEATDEKGHFKFKASPGNNTIKVDKEGYQMIEQQEKEIIEEYGEIYTGGSLNNNRDVSLNINIPMRKIR